MKKGFTLIELLITIIIVLVASSLGLAYYNNYSQIIILKSEALDFKKNLELIKKKAISSEKINNCTDQFNGYQIIINSNDYQWGILCPDFQLVKTITLPYGINFLNNQQIVFSPLIINFPSQISITIKSLQLNKCLDIIISTNGIIYLDEILKNCP